MILKSTAASRRHLLAGVTIAAAVSLLAAGSASADHSSATIRGQAVDGTSLDDTQTGQGEAFASRSVSDSHGGGPLAFMQIVASTRSITDPKNIAFTEAVNSLSPGSHPGLSSALTSAQATFQDTITVNGPAADAGKVVRIENFMTLTNDNTQHSQEINVQGASANANLSNHVKIEVAGTGIEDGPYGGSTFGFFDSVIARDHADTTNGPTVDGVLFSMDVVIGQPTAVNFTMTETADSILFDDTGGAQLLATLFYTYALDWGDTTHVTLLDRAGNDTGRTPGGLSIASDTGFSFLDGTTPGPTGVPEPAAWALMIAGFGLAGGSLRRTRQACPN
jgi:hypothetical protein